MERWPSGLRRTLGKRVTLHSFIVANTRVYLLNLQFHS